MPRRRSRPLVALRSSEGLALATLVVALSVTRHAVAESPPRSAALAEELFAQGMTELKSGRGDAACRAFAASQAADPSVGALLNLARCHETEGKTATAWAEYRDAARLAEQRHDRERQRGANELADALERRLARVTVEVTPGTPEVVVRLDAIALPATSLGKALPVDPGVHVVEARASGRAPWSTSVDVAPVAATTTVVVPVLPREERTSVGRGRFVTGIVLASLGGGALVAGGVQAVRALRMDGMLEGRCGALVEGARACDPSASDAIDDLRRTGNVATVLLAAGGGVALAGIVLASTAPGPSSAEGTGRALVVAPMVGTGSTGLSVQGAF